MHGDHPSAKPAPTRNALSAFFCLNCSWKRLLPGAQNVPDRECAGTHQYENAGKSRNEGATRQHHPPSNQGCASALLHLLDRDPRDQRQIGGHQRQHAGRQHGDEASHKCQINVRAQISHHSAGQDRGSGPEAPATPPRSAKLPASFTKRPAGTRARGPPEPLRETTSPTQPTRPRQPRPGQLDLRQLRQLVKQWPCAGQ